MAPNSLKTIRKNQQFHNLEDRLQVDGDRSPAKVNAGFGQARPSMNRASFGIQHVVRLMVKKSTYSREQNLNQAESAIRR
jgi:hypothetical protein